MSYAEVGQIKAPKWQIKLPKSAWILRLEVVEMAGFGIRQQYPIYRSLTVKQSHLFGLKRVRVMNRILSLQSLLS